MNKIGAGYRSSNALNTDFEIIEEGFERTLDRHGGPGNQMEAELDMNSNRIINLPRPVGMTEPVRLEDFLEFVSEGAGLTLVANPQNLSRLKNRLQPVFVKQDNSGFSGYRGIFYWSDEDLSATVTKDPAQAICVAPEGEDGSNGAWVRLFDGSANVKWWGARGDGVTDDWAALQAAFFACRGRSLFLPAGIYRSSKTLFTKRNTFIFGEGPDDDHNATGGTTGYGANLSTIIEFYGEGNGARYTDIGGGVTDKPDFRPGIVVGGRETKLHLMTIRNIEGGMLTSGTMNEAWDAAIFIAGVGRCDFYRVNTPGRWLNGVYADATWGRGNTTLRDLHPSVEGDAGLIENSFRECYIRGLWSVSILGTQRNPNDYTSANWVWSPQGTSDFWMENCTLTGGEKWYFDKSVRDLGGGSLRIDAAARNASRMGQGHKFTNCAFRTSAIHTVKLDKANNTLFVGSYGEQTETNMSDAIVEVSSATGKVTWVADTMKCQFAVDGVVRKTRMEDCNPSDLDGTKVSFVRADGSIISPAIKVPGSENDDDAILVSKSTTGSTFFQRLFGGVRSTLMVLTSDTLRPGGTRGLTLGVAGTRWGRAFVDSLDVRTAPTGTSSLILNGNGTPEGLQEASRGSIYMNWNVSAAPLWVKTTTSGTTGWQSVTLSGTNGS